jgi:hypothetical protein
MSDTCGRCGYRYSATNDLYDANKRAASLERQLAEAQAEISSLKKYFFMHENCRLGTGLCKRAQNDEAALINAVEKIERMRPVVEAMPNLLEAVTTEPFGYLTAQATLQGRLAWYERMQPARDAAAQALHDYEAKEKP